MTATKHDLAIAYARHCIGVHETSPNRGPIQVFHPDGGVDFFQEHDFVPGAGYPWCAAFWLTCWAEAGHPFPYLSPSAHALGDYAKQRGWNTNVAQLVPGDGCDWWDGSGHFSMFESYDRNAGIVHTIDGNWNNRVVRVEHPISHLRTAVHVPEAHKAPPAPKPFWVIATSHNGHKVLLFTQFATEKTILKILPKLLAKYGKQGITIKRGGVRKK